MGGQGLPAHGATGATNAAPTNNPVPLRLQRRLLKLAAGLVRGEEGLLLQDVGQGLPAHGATGATNAAPTNDLVAIRLQCRVPRVLPLPDQAVVREQARLVLPAHGPWLPDHAPALIQRRVMLKLGVFLCMHWRQERKDSLVCPIFRCLLLPSSSAKSDAKTWSVFAHALEAGAERLARLPHLRVLA